MGKKESTMSYEAARERAVIEGIERGLADMNAGRVVPHDEAMRRIRSAIDAAQ